MAVSQGRKYVPIFLEESLHREILVYAAETGQTMQDVLKPVLEESVQSIIKLVTQIREMRKQAYLQSLKEEEERKLTEENPLQVPGHPVELGTEIESIPA